MIPPHAELYAQLTPVQALYLWRDLHEQQLVQSEPDPSVATGPHIADLCRELSHAQVVLSISRRKEAIFYDIAEVLVRKPIYMCARGETGTPLTDIEGRPLPTPIGHRRGEPPAAPITLVAARKRMQYTQKLDPRVITSIAPNPKKPGSKAYARYSLYSEGMTVQQYLVAGGESSDIRYDVEHGFIKVDLPERGDR